MASSRTRATAEAQAASKAAYDMWNKRPAVAAELKSCGSLSSARENRAGRESMARLLGVLALLLVPLASFAQAPSPPPDWIDEFPSVTEVAHAAYEELKVTAQRSGIDPNDDDAIAINLAGTFVVLRQIMLLKYNEEPPMAKNREGKLRKLVASYLEAELTIGRGWAGRRGYIMRGPPTGMGCRDEACYRRWFLLHLNASSGRAEYRERVLNRLFPCGTLAKELNDLRQKHATTVPYMPSPAATLSIEKELAGIGTAGCAAYGGDSRQNGLCDGWTPPPAASTAGPIAPAPGVAAKASGGVATARAPSAPAAAGAPASGAFRTSSLACQPLIVLTKVMMAKGGGLLVSIAPTSAKEGDVVTFSVSRSKTDKPDGSAFWEKPAKIVKSGTGLQAVVASDAGARLTPDQSLPFLIVDTASQRSSGPVHCAQPTTNWELVTNGLHGPYNHPDDALREDKSRDIALSIMGSGFNHVETGYVVLRDRRASPPRYYTSPPIRTSEPAGFGLDPKFKVQDYGTSADMAIDNSCENREDYALVAIIHTHPNKRDFVDDNFSIADFETLFEILKKTPWPLEKMYMISARDNKVRMFTPCPNDRSVEAWFDLTNEYLPRVQILGPKNVPPPPCK